MIYQGLTKYYFTLSFLETRTKSTRKLNEPVVNWVTGECTDYSSSCPRRISKEPFTMARKLRLIDPDHVKFWTINRCIFLRNFVSFPLPNSRHTIGPGGPKAQISRRSPIVFYFLSLKFDQVTITLVYSDGKEASPLLHWLNEINH